MIAKPKSASRAAAMKRVGEANRTHGMRKSKTFGVWWQMIQRCRNPKHKAWGNYGGRGIVVCERWKDFANFLADMGEKPEGLSIDRIDNAGNYEPGNCRWATAATQARNRRTVALTFEKAADIWIEGIHNGMPNDMIARHYNCSQSAAAAVVQGRTWKDAAAQAEAVVQDYLQREAAGEFDDYYRSIGAMT